MRRVLLPVFAVVVVGMALTLTPAVAGGGGGGGCRDPEATEASASMVELRNACFTSTVTHIDPGQELAFVNRDDITHNVVGLGARWGDIEGMGRGETRRFTFGQAGIFPYACTLHPGMVGAVVVGGNELRAGDAGSVSAALSSGSAGTAAVPSTGASQTGDGGGTQLPETMLALALVVVLVGGLAGFVLRRRRGSPAGIGG